MFIACFSLELPNPYPDDKGTEPIQNTARLQSNPNTLKASTRIEDNFY